MLRFEDSSGDVVVQLRRVHTAYGPGESDVYRLDAMDLRLDGVETCLTDPDALEYENTHHNWLDVASGTSESGIRYVVNLLDQVSANDEPPSFAAYAEDGSVVHPETPVIATGRPHFCWSCPGQPAMPAGFSEILVNNVAAFADEEGEFDPWIELYNVTTSGVDLAGWTLSDDFADRGKWVFPSVVLAPGQLLVVFVDGQEEQGELHASFRLAAEGGEIVLTSPEGVTDGGLVYEALPADTSFAWDWGTDTFIEAEPTPGVPPPEGGRPSP